MTKKEALAEFLKVSIDKILESDDYDFEYDNYCYNVLDRFEIDEYIEDDIEFGIDDLRQQLKESDFGFLLNYIDYSQLRKDWINNTDIEDILDGIWFDEYYITQ